MSRSSPAASADGGHDARNDRPAAGQPRRVRRAFRVGQELGPLGPRRPARHPQLHHAGAGRAAAALVRSGRQVSMEIPINTVAGPDNPNPAIHFVSQAHDVDIGSLGLRFGLDFIGMACHGDCHSHVDALCHISYKGLTYNGKPAQEVLPSTGRRRSTSTATHRAGGPRCPSRPAAFPRGEVARAGRGGHPGRARGVRKAQGVQSARATSSSSARATIDGGWSSGPGTTGLRRARARPGSTSIPSPGCTSGRSRRSCRTATARRYPAVEGIQYPLHPLQITAMGMLRATACNWRIWRGCEAEGRFEFMVVSNTVNQAT